MSAFSTSFCKPFGSHEVFWGLRSCLRDPSLPDVLLDLLLVDPWSFREGGRGYTAYRL